MGGVSVKEKNKPIFLGCKSKESGIMHAPHEIPEEFKEKVRNAVITVLFNKSLSAG
jgi:hypothetical protein